MQYKSAVTQTVTTVIEETIDYIISKSKSICDEGWLDDANHFFCEHKAWSVAGAVITKDPRCLLELKAILSTSVNSLRELRINEQEIWRELAWSFEASAVNDYREASVLRFITVVRGDSSCTTGRMLVGGYHYHELVRRAENRRHVELPHIPFELDLSSLNAQLLNPTQLSTVRHDNDWNEDKLLIPEITKLIERIEACIAAGKENFFASEVSQDALRFNLDALSRTTVTFSLDRTDVSDWRKQLLQVAHPSTKPWQRDPDTIWIMAKEHVPRLLTIINGYRQMSPP